MRTFIKLFAELYQATYLPDQCNCSFGKKFFTGIINRFYHPHKRSGGLVLSFDSAIPAHFICGGAETEFSLVRFKGAEETARKVYEGFKPLSAQDVASIIFYTATLPAHVCINDLVVTCTQQANSYHFNKTGV